MRFVLLLVLSLAAVCTATHGEESVIDTSSLSGWREMALPFVPHPTEYAAVRVDGRNAIRITSNDGASALVYGKIFHTREAPYLHWSWKAMNVLDGGNAETQDGDDYAVRIHVMFPYNPDRVAFFERFRFEMGKQALGEYPPLYVLNYVWANRPHSKEPMENAFSARGAMFFPDAGTAYLGTWRSHTVNIVEDFRRAFGHDPEPTYRIVIMGDSDNTHGRTEAYIGDIRVGPEASRLRTPR